MLLRVNWKAFPRNLTGPDSLIPQLKDVKDFFRHLGWFFGICEAPRFDRWGYWEKFDYWAVFWGIPILGTTGLLLAYPLFASRIMPGWGLNVALWIHRIEAILAMCHIFLIHFFIAHLRRHNFPMDLTIFEGSTPLETVKLERTLWVSRLEEAGRLESSLAPKAPPALTFVSYLIGSAAMAFGYYLLIGGIANSMAITW